MKRFTLTIVLLAFGGLAAKAQTTWLDSTQALPPLAVANGVVVNMAELKPDLISAIDVFKGKKAKQQSRGV